MKANPDMPQLPVRTRALAEGKLLYLAVPRLRDPSPFLRLDPDRLEVTPRAAAVHQGIGRARDPDVGGPDRPRRPDRLRHRGRQPGRRPHRQGWRLQRPRVRPGLRSGDRRRRHGDRDHGPRRPGPGRGPPRGRPRLPVSTWSSPPPRSSAPAPAAACWAASTGPSSTTTRSPPSPPSRPSGRRADPQPEGAASTASMAGVSMAKWASDRLAVLDGPAVHLGDVEGHAGRHDRALGAARPG